MAESQLRALAAEITKLADSFAGALEEKGLPEASFSVDSPMKHEGITAEMFMTRQALCDKLSDMWYLVQGPSESIYNYVHNVRQKSPFNRLLNTEFFLKHLCLGYSGRCLSQCSQPLQLLGYRASRWLCVLFRDRGACLATGRCRHQGYSTCHYLTPVRRSQFLSSKAHKPFSGSGTAVGPAGSRLIRPRHHGCSHDGYEQSFGEILERESK